MKKHLLLLLLFMGGINIIYSQLPSVVLKTLEGKSVSADSLSNNGSPFIIDFFATWCKPCKRELDAISEVYDDWREETGVKIYAISIDQGQNIYKVRPMVESEGWEYEILLDPNGDFRQALGIQMIPYVLICDGKGKIVYRHNGYTDGEELELIETVRSLIQ